MPSQVAVGELSREASSFICSSLQTWKANFVKSY